MENEKLILVAEDDPGLNRLISFKLQKEGFQVISASDGRAALKMALDEEVDAVVLDIMMPYLDGLQVLRQLRREKPTLPVVMLSIKSLDKDISTALELGASDYLTKPFQPSMLVERLKRMLGE